jgi:hypothetical protein
MTISKYSVQVVDISSILSIEEMEVFIEMITNDYSWGDTDLSLVKRKNLLSTLNKRATNEYRIALIQKFVAATASNTEIFVNLY